MWGLFFGDILLGAMISVILLRGWQREREGGHTHILGDETIETNDESLKGGEERAEGEEGALCVSPRASGVCVGGQWCCVVVVCGSHGRPTCFRDP